MTEAKNGWFKAAVSSWNLERVVAVIVWHNLSGSCYCVARGWGWSEKTVLPGHCKKLLLLCFDKLFLTLSSASVSSLLHLPWQICNFLDALSLPPHTRMSSLYLAFALQISPTGVDLTLGCIWLAHWNMFSWLQRKLSFPLKVRLRTHVLRNLLSKYVAGTQNFRGK